MNTQTEPVCICRGIQKYKSTEDSGDDSNHTWAEGIRDNDRRTVHES